MSTDALNIELGLVQKVWALLNANPKWTAIVKVGNQVRDDLPGEHRRDVPKSIFGEGDFVNASVMPMSGTASLQTLGENFGTMSDTPPENWIERLNFVVRVIVVCSGTRVRDSSKVRTETVDSIRRAGPKAGLLYVTGIDVRWSTEKTAREDTGEIIREVVTVDIRFEVTVNGSTLEGEA